MPSPSTLPPPVPASARKPDKARSGKTPPPTPADARLPSRRRGPPPIPGARASRGDDTGRSTRIAEAARRAGEEASVLVEAARGGDPKAFGELVRRYRPRIYALALHMTGSESDADDIAQD